MDLGKDDFENIIGRGAKLMCVTNILSFSCNISTHSETYHFNKTLVYFMDFVSTGLQLCFHQNQSKDQIDSLTLYNTILSFDDLQVEVF